MSCQNLVWIANKESLDLKPLPFFLTQMFMVMVIGHQSFCVIEFSLKPKCEEERVETVFQSILYYPDLSTMNNGHQCLSALRMD